MSQQFLSVSMDNLFSFECPVFGQQVEMRGCVLVREKVYKGEQFSQRRGCQACISGGKCPAAEIVKRIAFNAANATDRCSSQEPRVGKLPADVLEQIRPTVLTEGQLARFGLSGAEMSLIQSANDRIDKQIATAPREQVAGRVVHVATTNPAKSRKSRPVAPLEAAVAKPDATVAAATSGDMSAAINAA